MKPKTKATGPMDDLSEFLENAHQTRYWHKDSPAGNLLKPASVKRKKPGFLFPKMWDECRLAYEEAKTAFKTAGGEIRVDTWLSMFLVSGQAGQPDRAELRESETETEWALPLASAIRFPGEEKKFWYAGYDSWRTGESGGPEEDTEFWRDLQHDALADWYWAMCHVESIAYSIKDKRSPDAHVAYWLGQTLTELRILRDGSKYFARADRFEHAPKLGIEKQKNAADRRAEIIREHAKALGWPDMKISGKQYDEISAACEAAFDREGLRIDGKLPGRDMIRMALKLPKS